MLITCTNCGTQFNLDDSLYSPGRKLRCSVCSHIFIMPAVVLGDASEPAFAGSTAQEPVNSPEQSFEQPDYSEAEFNTASSLPDELEIHDEDETPAKPAAKKKALSKGKKLALLIVALIIIFGAAVFSLFHFNLFNINSLFEKKETVVVLDPVEHEISGINKVKNLQIKDVKQYNVDNTQVGRLIVISGKVRNNFSVPKDMIKIEASLYNAKGAQIAAQQQYAGITLSILQLKILGKDDLVRALTNMVEIYVNNTNIQPGAEVPFTVVFIYPPATMKQFAVRVVDVQDPPSITPTPAQ